MEITRETHKTICVECGTELPYECMRSFCPKCKKWVFHKNGKIKEIKR